MDSRHFDAKSLSESILTCQSDPWESNANQNTAIFLHGNWFENIACIVAAICLALNVLCLSIICTDNHAFVNTEEIAQVSFFKTWKLDCISDKLESSALQWRYNERDGVSNHRRLDCLFNGLFSAHKRKHQCSASLAFVRGIHRWPVNSPHKGPVTRKMFPFDDVFMLMTSSCVFDLWWETTSIWDHVKVTE